MAGRTVATRASGAAVGLAGLAFVGIGLWGRREVRTGLARERIVNGGSAVTSGVAARSLAETIRRSTLDATAGRTYGETDLYVDAEGRATSSAEQALQDERTGRPVENPEVALWLQSTTLQTALMQAYMASRVADLAIGLGAAFVAAGAGLVAAAGRQA